GRRLGRERDEAHVERRLARVEPSGLEVAARVAHRVRLRRKHARDNDGRSERSEEPELRRVFHLSGSWESSWRMAPISAVCTLTTSLAKTLTSTSCPARGVANRSFTICSAPSWCW